MPDGATLVFGMFPLFAAREERIQVHVGDPAMFLLGVCHALLMAGHSGRQYCDMGAQGQDYYIFSVTGVACERRRQYDHGISPLLQIGSGISCLHLRLCESEFDEVA